MAKYISITHFDNKGIIPMLQSIPTPTVITEVSPYIKHDEKYPNKTDKSFIDSFSLIYRCRSEKQYSQFSYFIKHWFSLMHLRNVAGGSKSDIWPKSVLLKGHKVNHLQCGSVKENPKTRQIKLHLSGNGCNWIYHFDNTFEQLVSWAKQLNGRLLNVHIALDDISGRYGIDWAMRAYSRDRYKSASGPKPSKTSLKMDGARTIKIGKDDSPKNMVIYQKGKQCQLKPDNPLFDKWTRHELRFNYSRGHKLTCDMLLEPNRYFVGAYLANKTLLKNTQPLGIQRSRTVIEAAALVKKIDYTKKQCGKTIHALSQLGLTEKQIVGLTQRASTAPLIDLKSMAQQGVVTELLSQLKQQRLIAREKVSCLK